MPFLIATRYYFIWLTVTFTLNIQCIEQFLGLTVGSIALYSQTATFKCSFVTRFLTFLFLFNMKAVLQKSASKSTSHLHYMDGLLHSHYMDVPLLSSLSYPSHQVLNLTCFSYFLIAIFIHQWVSSDVSHNFHFCFSWDFPVWVFPAHI